MHPTKQRLIDEGLRLLLEQGYSSVGIQALLDATETPKGSFYHHFKDKEDFALQVWTPTWRRFMQGSMPACSISHCRPLGASAASSR